MFDYNSETDESLEDMKLDLIKAKYTHEKLKNKFPNTQKKMKKTKTINNNHSQSIHKSIKCPNDIAPSKSTNLPTISKRKRVTKRDNSINENKIENSYDDSEEEIDDEEDADISKMNEYIDYLLNKKRISINDEEFRNIYSRPSNVVQEVALSSNDFRPSEINHRSSSDLNLQNVPSRDILAQWRLRRKMNEAQNAVKDGYKRHDTHADVLRLQAANYAQSLEPRYNPFLQNSVALLVSEKIPNSNEQDCDQIPVRDTIKNNQDITSGVTKTHIPDIPKIPETSNVSCQCELEKQTGTPQQDKVSKNPRKSKSSQSFKNQRSVAIMTCSTSKQVKTSELIDCFTQTDSNDDRPVNPPRVARSTEWDDRSACPDYIDRAIEKTLHSQLFECSSSPAMSVISSINEPLNIDSVVPKSSQSLLSNSNIKENINNDTVFEELPWNENFHIESEDEFQQDEVLMDLRRRRQLNLEKLRDLSLKIQKFKISCLATVESC